MENSYCIYKHTNKINNKVYIGITKQDIRKRWGKNGQGYSKCTLFFNAIKKYGWDQFEHEILEVGLSKTEACLKEKQLIKQYQSNNPKYGYNIESGGSPGPTDFIKMTEWQQKNKKFGQDNVNSKKVRCKETGDVFGSIAEANRWSGTSHVGSCCKHKRNTAGTHPTLQIPLTWEYAPDDAIVTVFCHERIKEKQPMKKAVRCIETNEIFESGAAAAVAKGVTSPCNILRCCNHKRKSAHGYTWEFVIEEEKK